MGLMQEPFVQTDLFFYYYAILLFIIKDFMTTLQQLPQGLYASCCPGEHRRCTQQCNITCCFSKMFFGI